MPRRIRPDRRDKFVILIAGGMRQGAAYREAGYSAKGADRNASRLVKNNKVARRIAAERARIAGLIAQKEDEHIEALVIDNIKVERDLEIARRGALEAEQYAAAVSASIGQARVAKLIEGKNDTNGSQVNVQVNIDLRQVEQIRAEIKALEAEIVGSDLSELDAGQEEAAGALEAALPASPVPRQASAGLRAQSEAEALA